MPEEKVKTHCGSENFIIFVSGESEINKHSTPSVLCSITIAQLLYSTPRSWVQISESIHAYGKYILTALRVAFFQKPVLFLYCDSFSETAYPMPQKGET